MRSALLDITDLIKGRRFDDDDDLDSQPDLDLDLATEPTEEAAVRAIDRVCRRWPQAQWTTNGSFGRITGRRNHSPGLLLQGCWATILRDRTCTSDRQPLPTMF